MTEHAKKQIEEIKVALRDRNLTSVSEATGLNPHTIYRLVNGKVTPNQSTLNLLTIYLRGQAVISD